MNLIPKISKPKLPNLKTENGKWWRVLRFKRDKTARVAVDSLMENSRLEASFFVMCTLSGVLATLGILLNDVAILIAAMVLAPLLNPVLAFAAGISIMNKKLVAYATKSFLGSVLFVILIAAITTQLLVLLGYNFDIKPFEQKFNNLDHLFFLAAFVSGFSGVYAWLRDINSTNIVGVAIAVSLIPFVSFMGILVGLEKYSEIDWYLFNFSVNIATIILGATSAFLLLGFSRQKKVLDAEVAHNTDED